ncbi:hypothetical protein Ait01nite_090460 [Actinoplanes italicus]|uniref:WD40 repeat protein n=1 Tax=Actinoplanes italicus TaxID=113567 RepID=A0A2T0JTM6_9ACTN|nr:hypothetical protein [Actinoplanes italicus]PRX11016.1 hypothetical protein CLV67_13274 [Actinoplanes italicus]GIE36001.1 hypothetical protein Ait01nite_090460 [Actinoplanes italicus]
MGAGVLPRWAGRLAKSAAAVTVLALLVICCGAVGVLREWHPIGGSPQPRAQGAGTLPARIGAPSPWTPDAATAPIGAASVLYSSNTWFPDESGWLAGMVGRADDTYRVAEWYGAAGMGAVLSPDGSRLAFDEGVADLATGRVTGYRGLPGQLDDLRVEAQAWSPDGRTVALLVSRLLDHGDPDDITRLLIADATTGATSEIATLSTVASLSGWTVAFSPDGTRLAYQNRDRISIRTLAGGATVDVPATGRVAGKGAWTRDGRGLLVVSGVKCDCPGWPVRWTVTPISAADGAVTGPSYGRDGIYALRVLGWWPSGEPVAVEYTPTGHAESTLFTSLNEQYELTSQDGIEAARLIALASGQRLLAGDESGMAGDVESIDVADDVLAAGKTRPGDPPLLDIDTLAVVLATAVVVPLLLLLALAVWWLTARRGSQR